MNSQRFYLSLVMICGTYFDKIPSLFLVYGKYCPLCPNTKLKNPTKTVEDITQKYLSLFSQKVSKTMSHNKYWEVDPQLNPDQTNTGKQSQTAQVSIMSQRFMENATERLRQNRAMNSTKSPGAPIGAVPVSNVEDISTRLVTNPTRAILMNYILVTNLSNIPSVIDQQLDYIENVLGIPLVPQSLEIAIPYPRDNPPAQTPTDWVEVTSQARHPAIIVEIATPIRFGRCPTQASEPTDTEMEWDADDQTYLSIDADTIQTLPRISRHVCWHHPPKGKPQERTIYITGLWMDPARGHTPQWPDQCPVLYHIGGIAHSMEGEIATICNSIMHWCMAILLWDHQERGVVDEVSRRVHILPREVSVMKPGKPQRLDTRIMLELRVETREDDDDNEVVRAFKELFPPLLEAAIFGQILMPHAVVTVGGRNLLFCNAALFDIQTKRNVLYALLDDAAPGNLLVAPPRVILRNVQLDTSPFYLLRLLLLSGVPAAAVLNIAYHDSLPNCTVGATGAKFQADRLRWAGEWSLHITLRGLDEVNQFMAAREVIIGNLQAIATSPSLRVMLRPVPEVPPSPSLTSQWPMHRALQREIEHASRISSEKPSTPQRVYDLIQAHTRRPHQEGIMDNEPSPRAPSRPVQSPTGTKSSSRHSSDRSSSPRKHRRSGSRDADMDEDTSTPSSSVIDDWARLDPLDAMVVLQHILAEYLDYLSTTLNEEGTMGPQASPAGLIFPPSFPPGGPLEEHLHSIQRDLGARLSQQPMLPHWNRQTSKGQLPSAPTPPHNNPWKPKGSADYVRDGNQDGRFHHGTSLGHHSTELSNSPGGSEGQLSKGSSANTLGDGPPTAMVPGRPEWQRGKECSANSMGDGPWPSLPSDRRRDKNPACHVSSLIMVSTTKGSNEYRDQCGEPIPDRISLCSEYILSLRWAQADATATARQCSPLVTLSKILHCRDTNEHSYPRFNLRFHKDINRIVQVLQVTMMNAQRDPLLTDKTNLWQMWNDLSTASQTHTSLPPRPAGESLCPTTFVRLLQHTGFFSTLWIADNTSDLSAQWARLGYTVTSRRIVSHRDTISPPMAGMVWPRAAGQYHIVCVGDHYFTSSQGAEHVQAQHELARMIRALLRRPNGSQAGIPIQKGPLTWWLFRMSPMPIAEDAHQATQPMLETLHIEGIAVHVETEQPWMVETPHKQATEDPPAVLAPHETISSPSSTDAVVDRTAEMTRTSDQARRIRLRRKRRKSELHRCREAVRHRLLQFASRLAPHHTVSPPLDVDPRQSLRQQTLLKRRYHREFDHYMKHAGGHKEVEVLSGVIRPNITGDPNQYGTWTKCLIKHPAYITPFTGQLAYGLESSLYACQLEGIHPQTDEERFIEPTHHLWDPGYFYYLPPGTNYPPAPRAPGAHINTLHPLQVWALNPDGSNMFAFNVTWDEIKEVPQQRGDPIILNTPHKPTDVIWIVSTRDIEDQEELLLDYGDEYVLPLPTNWKDLIRALPPVLPGRVEQQLEEILGRDFRTAPDLPGPDRIVSGSNEQAKEYADQSHRVSPPAQVLGKEYRSDRKNAVEPTHPDLPLIFLSSTTENGFAHAFIPPQYIGSYVNAEIFNSRSGTPYLVAAMIHLEYRASFRMVPSVINARREFGQPEVGRVEYCAPCLVPRYQWEQLTNPESWALNDEPLEQLIHMLWVETGVRPANGSVAEYTLRLHPMVIRGLRILVNDTPCNPALLSSVRFCFLFHQHSLLKAGGINPSTVAALRREVQDTIQWVAKAQEPPDPDGPTPQATWIRLVHVHIATRHVTRYPLPRNWHDDVPQLRQLANADQQRRLLNWRCIRRLVHQLCLLPHHPRTPLTREGAYPANGVTNTRRTPPERRPENAGVPNARTQSDGQWRGEGALCRKRSSSRDPSPVLRGTHSGLMTRLGHTSQTSEVSPGQTPNRQSRAGDIPLRLGRANASREGEPGSEGSNSLGVGYRSDTKNAVAGDSTLGRRTSRRETWMNANGWLNFLEQQQINPDSPTHLGRAYSSDPVGDAVDPPTDFPDSIPRRLSPEAMSQAPGWSQRTGCRIGTWNIAGKLSCRDIGEYMHVIESTDTDIMVLIDTGLVARAAYSLDRRIAAFNRNNNTMISQFSCYAHEPAKRKGGTTVGGITVLVREKWTNHVSSFCTDATETGSMFRFQLSSTHGTFQIIAMYWPCPTTDDTRVGALHNIMKHRLTSPDLKAFRGSPQDWIRHNMETWSTVAQGAGIIPIAMGDFNASNIATSTAHLGCNGRLDVLLRHRDIISVNEAKLPDHRTYWRDHQPLSTLDHILVQRSDLPSISAVYTYADVPIMDLSDHRPIGVMLSTGPPTELAAVPLLNISRIIELNIDRGADMTYVNAANIKALNDRLEDWCDRVATPDLTAEQADRNLLHLSTLTTRFVAEQNALTQSKFKGKPHGWSPTQVVLYAKLDALITIRRRLYGLHHSVQWTHQNVARGIKHATHNWKRERAKYLHRGFDQAHDGGCSVTQLRLMPITGMTMDFMDGEIQMVSNQLHFVKRKRLRSEISEAIARRQVAFEAGGIRAVLDSVLQRRTSRFDYSKVYAADGTVITGGEAVHKALTAEFINWYKSRELVALAQHLNNHKTIWKDFTLQAALPDHLSASEYPPEMTRLLTHALLHTSPDRLPQLHADMAQVLTESYEYTEFRGAINHRANNRSPGISGLTSNMAKAWSDKVAEVAFNYMNVIWEARHVPDWWKDKWMIMVPKVFSAQLKTSDLRPISLLETTRKIWTALLMTKISGVLNKHHVLQEMQAGFRSQRSTETSLVQFLNALELSQDQASPLYYTSYDISKAFDRPEKGLIRLAWNRVGIPPDIADWLARLDEGGQTFIKSPWAQAKIPKRGTISHTSVPSITQEVGVPQGSSEGGLTWLVIFDILLTMLHLAQASDFYIEDNEGQLHPQMPTAFADDLLTYASTPEMQQRQATITSFFCMMTGLELKPSKMVARAINVGPQEVARHQPLSLLLIDGTTGTLEIESDMDGAQGDAMRYLGIFIDIDNTWENQYKRVRSKVAETVRIITKARASPTIKWYALSMCGYAAVTYPAKFAPWTLAQYQDLVRPLDAAMRNLNSYRPTSPASLIYGAHRFGQLGLPSLHDRIQAEKFNLLQRTQETGGLPAIAADNMLTRVAQNLAIPHIVQSPVTLGCLVPEDMRNLRLFAGSIAQYVSDRGCSLHKRGRDDWNSLNVRVPRPMNGSHSVGAPGWLRKFDIQTVNDLTTGAPGNPTAPAIWRTFPSHPHEPPWILPMTTGTVPTGSTRLRRGMLLYTGGSIVYEYLGFQTDDEMHVRCWAPADPESNDRIQEGAQLRCTSQYHGRGGETVVPTLLATTSSQVVFHMAGVHGQGQTLTVESLIFREWDLPWMRPARATRVPWIDQVLCKLRAMGLTGAVTMHGDASYVLHPVDPSSFARPPNPENAYVAGGIVIATKGPGWRHLPSLVIQVQNGQEMHMDSAYPMELLVLEIELLLSKQMGVHNTITTDCQSALNTVQQSMREGTPTVPRRGQAHITNTCFRQLPRPDQCTLVKVKAHIERRQSDRAQWADDEYGNFLADCAADPDWEETIRPTNTAVPALLPRGEFLALDATTVLQSVMLPATWNLHDHDMRPAPWSFLRRENEDRRQLHYLSNREHHSAHIQRHREWTKREMHLAATLWNYSKQTKPLQRFITRILYDQHWHGANRAKDHLLSPEEHAHQLRCELCGHMDGQEHIVGICPHPAMAKARRRGRALTLEHLTAAIEAQDPDLPESRRWVAETLLRWWHSKELSISAKWIGIWTTNESTRFAQDIVMGHPSVSWSGKPISKALAYLYRPIIATTSLLYRIRSQLLQERTTINVPRAHPIIKDWFKHISIAAAELHHPPCGTPSSQGVSQEANLPPTPLSPSNSQASEECEDPPPDTTPLITQATGGPRGSYSYLPPRTYIPTISMMSIDMSSLLALSPTHPSKTTADPGGPLPPLRRSRTPSNYALMAAEKQKDTRVLNLEFWRQRKEGCDWVEIIDTGTSKGLGLRARCDILATENTPIRLCEYSGEWKALPSQEKLADISTQDLTHGVEVTVTAKTGKQRRWRISANHPLDNIGRYGNAPDGNTPPNARLVLRKDNKVWVEIFAPIRKGEDVLIDYGPYYWIYFWRRLSLEAQVHLQWKWRSIPFPPLCPGMIALPSTVSIRAAEKDYMSAAVNTTDSPMSDHQVVPPTVTAPQLEQVSIPLVLRNHAPSSLMGHGFALTQRWIQRKTWKGENAMTGAIALGMCLVDRTHQGKKYATPRTSQMVRGYLVGVLQRHLSEYQALAGQHQENSTTAARLAPLRMQDCSGVALDENSGSNSPIPIDIMTARFGLRHMWEALQTHQRRPAYDMHIVAGTSIDLLPAHPQRLIAIIMNEDGRCALLTKGEILRQACEGLVKLLPQKQLSHREAHALLHPTRAQPPPPPPRMGRITTFLEGGTEPHLPLCLVSPTYVGSAPSLLPLNPTQVTPPTLSNSIPRIEDLTPYDTSKEWCTRSLRVTQVHPGITMHLVPVIAHPEERAWETSLFQTKESALQNWMINWALRCQCIRVSWDKSPLAFPGSYWLSPTLEALYRSAGCTPDHHRRMQKSLAGQDHLSDSAIQRVICLTKVMTLWVNNPTTGIPTLHEDMMFTIPTAINILSSTHLISYQRGLLVVPPRICKEEEPWEDHPIMQTLHTRITAKWRDHQDNLSPELLLPKAQKVIPTPEHLHGATAWLLNPQTAHIGSISVIYRPSPVATYAWLSSWQSGLRKLHPNNIHEWLGRWLHIYPSLHLETRCTLASPSVPCWWSQWLTQLAHTRLFYDNEERPSSTSPEAIMEFLHRRMDVTDPTTRPLLRDYLDDLLNM